MPRVVSHAEVEAVPEGGTLRIAPDAIVTPLAREHAVLRGVSIEAGDATPAPQLVRQVTRQVVARLPDASPEVIEAVIAEILGNLNAAPEASGERFTVGGPDLPSLEVCASCLEADRARARSRALLTVTGRNQRGIAAAVTAVLAELSADILDISQTLVGDFFTMIVVFDTRALALPFDETRAVLETRMGELGMKAAVMHEDVLQSLHRV
jgi:ACT domain-containing protein